MVTNRSTQETKEGTNASSNKNEKQKYVSRKSTFMSTYSYIVKPSNGPKLWPETGTDPILPPVMRRAPGRPKKKRNKANDEPRLSNKIPRLLQTVKCKKCGKLGHNVRTCKGKTAIDREIPKCGNNKKKKKTAAVDGSQSQGSQAPQVSQPSQSQEAQAPQVSQPSQSQEAQRKKKTAAVDGSKRKKKTAAVDGSQAPQV